MVNYDLLLLVVFYLLLLVIFKIYRNKFEVQWKVFALYKTKIGLKLMNSIAKKVPSLLYVFGYFGIFIGFLGMIFIFGFVVWASYRLVFVPAADAVLAPVLPGISISEQLPVLSFWHWIIAILIVAVVHEFSHGVYARLRNIKVKSSGFAFLGPILAAFVEPDEKQLKKKRIRDQLLVFSAGPFSNIILGILIFLIMAFVFIPIQTNMVEVNGIIISSINSTLPIGQSGLTAGHIIQKIDGIEVDDVNTITNVLKNKKPGDEVSVVANKTSFNVVLAEYPEDKTRGFLGISFSGYDSSLKNESLSWLYGILKWFNMLLFWTFNISIGVGLFNLLPLGPVDGGRMFHAAMLKITKNERKALRLLNLVSMVVLFLIIVNLMPFIIRFLKWILSPF